MIKLADILKIETPEPRKLGKKKITLLSRPPRASKKVALIKETVRQARQYVKSGKLDPEALTTFIEIDPSETNKYVGWMAKQVINKNVTDMDLLKNTIEKFDVFLRKNKTKTKDINKFKSFRDLKDEVDHLIDTGLGVSVKNLESDYEVVLNNSDLLVVVPHSHEASRKLGLTKFAFRDCDGGKKDSPWCTTHKSPLSFFDVYYKDKITLYYVKVKSKTLMNKLKQAFPKKWKFLIQTAISVYSGGRIATETGINTPLSRNDIAKYIKILGINDGTLVPRRLKKRRENYPGAIERDKQKTIKKIQQYVKNNSKGDLVLRRNSPTSLPNNLNYVEGNLQLMGTKIRILPSKLKVDGEFTISSSPVVSLPDNLTVGGRLTLRRTPIKSLPSNLKVGSHIYIENTPISSLPDNLTVNGVLSLSYTNMKYLPAGLKVEEDFRLRKTPLSEKYSKEEIRKMIEDKGGYVKGKIYV